MKGNLGGSYHTAPPKRLKISMHNTRVDELEINKDNASMQDIRFRKVKSWHKGVDIVSITKLGRAGYCPASFRTCSWGVCNHGSLQGKHRFVEKATEI